MTFEHQMRMVNLLTRVGWEIRYAVYGETARYRQPRFHAPPSARNRERNRGTISCSSMRLRWTEKFKARRASPKVRVRRAIRSQSRSLRQFNLENRLMRYPLSYMIYSPAFDALPAESKGSIVQRCGKC